MSFAAIQVGVDGGCAEARQRWSAESGIEWKRRDKSARERKNGSDEMSSGDKTFFFWTDG